MRISLAVVSVFSLAACKRSEDSPPSPPIARFLFNQDPTVQPDRVATGRFEIAGVLGDSFGVDVPLAKLPPDLRGLPVSLVFLTPCGVKKLAVPLAPNDHAQPGEPYKLEQVHDPAFGYYFSTTLPNNPAFPQPTRVYVDPDTSGPLAIGAIAGTVTKGVPDEKLAGRPIDAASRGFMVQEIDCGASLTIDGHATPIPAGKGALFVTAHLDACFADEEVGYGDAGSQETKLTGATAYRLHASSYSFYFTPATRGAETGVGSRGTTRTRLDRCP